MEIKEIQNRVFKRKKKEYLHTAAYSLMISVVIFILGFLFFTVTNEFSRDLLLIYAMGSMFSFYGGFKFQQYIIIRTVEDLVYDK